MGALFILGVVIYVVSHYWVILAIAGGAAVVVGVAFFVVRRTAAQSQYRDIFLWTVRYWAATTVGVTATLAISGTLSVIELVTLSALFVPLVVRERRRVLAP